MCVCVFGHSREDISSREIDVCFVNVGKHNLLCSLLDIDNL